MAILMDGKATAQHKREQIKEQAEVLRAQGVIPGLAVVIVGQNPASKTYVKNKIKACAECKIESFEYALPEETTERELLELIEKLNADDAVNGILVQLPLPKHISEHEVIHTIVPAKDVDAFHPENVGRIMIGDFSFVPCTPAGVMELLKQYDIAVKGKQCVVVGRSNIVGKPQAMLLLHEHGTVTICHSRTADLPAVTRQADILVAAVGQRNFITADMVKEGAVVIDVGMNRDPEGKLCGDVDFAAVEKKASYITPVPGGVGPMTITMLMQNTLRSAQDSMR